MTSVYRSLGYLEFVLFKKIKRIALKFSFIAVFLCGCYVSKLHVRILLKQIREEFYLNSVSALYAQSMCSRFVCVVNTFSPSCVSYFVCMYYHLVVQFRICEALF